MSQIQNEKTNLELDKKYDRRAIKRIAPTLVSLEDAEEVSQALRDDATTRKHSPVIWRVRTLFNVMLTCAAVCAALIVVLIWHTVSSSEELIGMSLYATLAAVTIAAAIGAWAAFRARVIHREDARYASTIGDKEVEEAGRFVRTFGPAPWDNAGMLLALAGGVDGALAGVIIGTGLAKSLPLLFVLLCAVMFALTFVAALRWIAMRFSSSCFAVRAKNWVRNATRIDTTRFPEKAGEANYLRERLGPLCDGNFSKPRLSEYLAAAGLLALVPALFAFLVIYRLYWANADGAADMVVVLGVSVLCGILATLGAALGAMGHILREEARTKTAIHRRFPTAAVFQKWHGSYERSCERWANDHARAINAEMRMVEQDADDQWEHRGLAIPRPFANQPPPVDKPGTSPDISQLVTP